MKNRAWIWVCFGLLVVFGDVGWVYGQDEECGEEEATQLLIDADPNLQNQIDSINNVWEQYVLSKGKGDGIFPVNATPVTIPTVVHVMHNNNPSMITKDLIIEAIEAVNNNLRNQSGLPGSGIGENLFVQLKLANRDTSGNCTDGIIYVNTTDDVGSLIDQVDIDLKAQSRWNPDKFLNIYIVRCITSSQANCQGPGTNTAAAGYAFTPPSLFSPQKFFTKDGIVILQTSVRRDHVAGIQRIRKETLTHEFGHYIGLSHTFQGNCHDPNDCLTEGDCICDTDPCKSTGPSGSTGFPNFPSFTNDECIATSTDCNPIGEYPIWNYMSYGSCRSEFTPNQRERVHFILQNHRAELITHQNLTDAGIATVHAEELTICEGDTTTLIVTADDDVDAIEWTVLSGDNNSMLHSNRDTIMVAPNDTTTYLVEVNKGGECFDSDEITIYVIPKPTLIQTAFNMCDGDPILIDLDRDFREAGMDSIGYKYEWFLNNQQVSTNGQLEVYAPNIYDVYITDTSTNCTNVQMITVEAVGGFSAELQVIPNGTTFCQEVDLLTNITPTAPNQPAEYTYQWSTDSTINENRIGFFEEGVHTISVSITDQVTQCVEIVSQTLTFQLDTIQPIFDTIPDTTNCGLFLLVNNAAEFDHFRWYANGEKVLDEIDSTYTDSIYHVQEVGNYYVIGVGNGVNCENKSEEQVFDYEDLVPNPISPNAPQLTLNATGQTTWGGENAILPQGTVTGYIVVEDGQKLVIQPQIIVNNNDTTIVNDILQFYDGNSGIKVNEGGILVVDGDVSLKASDCGTEWGGIIVYGDGLEAHPNYLNGTPSSSNSFVGSPDHGLVALINGATIENARTAVESPGSYNSVDSNGQPISIGGGIIYADGAKFTNNNTGLKMGRFLAVGNGTAPPQQSVIKNCHFLHNQLWEEMGFYAAYSQTAQAANKGYEQAFVFIAGEGLQITDNTFESNISSSIHSEHGTGLRIVATPITIGEEGNEHSNTFDGLYKGIDLYQPLSVQETAIINNQFEKVYKGITLNTTPSASILANTFNVPTANFSNKETYGILAHQSFGFDISNNCFVTGGGSSIASFNFTKGIVLKDCNFNGLGGSNMSSVGSNTFDGKFKAATQIEGNSTTLQLRCNDYDQTIAPLRDWQLPEKSADLQAETDIDPQGKCPNINAENVVFSSRWHTPSNGTYHIYNGTDKIFTFEHDIGSAATQIFGQVPQNNLCTNQLGQGIDANCINYSPNNDCNAPPLLAATGGTPFPYYYPYPTNPYPNNTCTVYGEHIRYLLANRQTQSVLDILHCRNSRESNKLLAATYVIRRDTNAVNTALNNIPDNNYTDHEFKTLIRAVLNNRIYDVERIAGYQYSENAAYAQSFLATLQEKNYDRVSAKVEENQSHSKRVVDNFYSEGQDRFTVFPNPTNGIFNIQIPSELFKGDSLPLLIHDRMGQLVKTILLQATTTSVNLMELKNGIYYCRIEGFDKTEKLVLIK